MTEWNEMLDQALHRYANPPLPGGMEARILTRAEQKRRRRRRGLLILAPAATACAAAIVAGVMVLHELSVRPPTNATATVANTKSPVAFPLSAQQTPRPTLSLHVRTRPRTDANAVTASSAPVFPAPLPLTAEELRMQALARNGTAIVPPEDSELVISRLDIQPIETNNSTNPGANDEQTEP